MQHELSAVRSKADFDIAGDLPKKNIDTGLGLERMASLLQGVDNMYEIDEIYPVLARGGDERSYGSATARPPRRPIRTTCGCGWSPTTCAPGSCSSATVSPRATRAEATSCAGCSDAAVRSMRLLGYQGQCLPELLPISLERMRQSYPELEQDFERISSIAYGEEEAFRGPSRPGTTILDTAVAEVKRPAGRPLRRPGVQLHDTYGFPIDLTLEMAAEQGLAVDPRASPGSCRAARPRQGRREGQEGRTRRHRASTARSPRRLAGEVEFTGYDEVSSEGGSPV
jgi:alanyl-tRNA synthetase